MIIKCLKCGYEGEPVRNRITGIGVNMLACPECGTGGQKLRIRGYSSGEFMRG